MSHIDQKFELALTIAFDAVSPEVAERIRQSIQNAAILSAQPHVILADLIAVKKEGIITLATERIKLAH